VIGLFCLDPDILHQDDVAPARVSYMLGCLEALQTSYRRAGSDLLILQGDPVQKIAELAVALKAQAVYWNRDVEPYSRLRDNQVAAALKAEGIERCAKTWDQLLQAPGTVKTGADQPYTVYTPFWRNWVKQAKADPAMTFADAVGLDEKEHETAQLMGVMPLPSAKALGFVWQNGFLLEPGEAAAIEQLETFCRSDGPILNYDEDRNFPVMQGTSLLSPALKFGAIGIRQVWAMAAQLQAQARSDESHNNIQTWMQELAWREFYQHVMYFFPELADGPYRAVWRVFPWDNHESHFQAWCAGLTGYPIVDAAMRQLKETGWMHNRCRMIVASFLTKDLIINWQWGEKYFMQQLVDGDLSANNGGWQWSASSGMDPKPLRIFNPASQAQKFDSEAEYIRQWLPEIRQVETEYLVTGKIPAQALKGTGYPLPIVDHKRQQAVFKERYQAVKGGGVG
jgi:deoxyribodipyrimidine photo-lyase